MGESLQAVVVLEKIFGGLALIVWEATRLSEITIETIKNLGGLGKIWGACAPRS